MTYNIIGSTGSIGRQALDVIAQTGGRARALAAHGNAVLLEQQARIYKPQCVALYDERVADDLRVRLADTDTNVYGGRDAIETICCSDADMLLNAACGVNAIRPTLRAIENGVAVALANKESLVCAGHIVMDAVRRHNATLLPVDSEHSALWQCMQGHNHAEIDSVTLTATGGALYGVPLCEREHMSPERVLAHPTWLMGPGITVDCATMVNKGYEVIEAHMLFDLPYDKIHVLIHRQSIVHAFVHLIDGATIAHMGVPDMRLPIAYALCHPRREPVIERLNLARTGTLTFADVDDNDYPLYALTLEAGRQGGLLPAVLCAANTAAVRAYLDNRIGFGDIRRIVERVLSDTHNIHTPTLDEILDAIQVTTATVSAGSPAHREHNPCR